LEKLSAHSACKIARKDTKKKSDSCNSHVFFKIFLYISRHIGVEMFETLGEGKVGMDVGKVMGRLQKLILSFCC